VIPLTNVRSETIPSPPNQDTQEREMNRSNLLRPSGCLSGDSTRKKAHQHCHETRLILPF
jgi:hypothetical protein